MKHAGLRWGIFVSVLFMGSNMLQNSFHLTLWMYTGREGLLGWLHSPTIITKRAPNEPITLWKSTKLGKITLERVTGCKPPNIFVFSPPCYGPGFVTDSTRQLRIFLAALLGLRWLFWKKEQKSCFTFADPDSFTAGRGNWAVWISICWTLDFSRTSTWNIKCTFSSPYSPVNTTKHVKPSASIIPGKKSFACDKKMHLFLER